MLLSLVSLSTVCLGLAYSGWDASDFPPGTDLMINQDDAFLQPQLDALEQVRDGILLWLSVYKEGPEDPRDCCGIPTTQQYNDGTSLQEKRDNNTDMVFLSTTVTFKWTGASHQTNEDIPNKSIDALGVNIDRIDEYHSNDQKRTPVYTTQSHGETRDSRVVYYHSNDTSSITETTSLTSVLVGDIINYTSYSLDSSSHGPSIERYINHSEDSASLATTEKNATSHYFDQSLSFFNYWSFIHDYSTIDDDNNNRTDEVCQDEQFCDEHITLKNETSFGDDCLTLVIIRLLVAAIFHKYKPTGKKRLRLPKGVTVTPVLYRRGKYLELGLSKYLRRCSVSKPEIVSTSTSSLKDVNYDRPGLELSPSTSSLKDVNYDRPGLELSPSTSSLKDVNYDRPGLELSPSTFSLKDVNYDRPGLELSPSTSSLKDVNYDRPGLELSPSTFSLKDVNYDRPGLELSPSTSSLKDVNYDRPGLELSPSTSSLKDVNYDRPGLELSPSTFSLKDVNYDRPGLELSPSTSSLKDVNYDRPGLELSPSTSSLKDVNYDRPGLELSPSTSSLKDVNYDRPGLELSPSTSSLKDVNYDRPGLELSRHFNIDCQNPGQASSLVINRSYFLHNIPIPGSLNTPSPFLSVRDLIPVIQSLEGPPERLKYVCLQNLPMICDREDVKSQKSEQQTSEIKKNSLETQLIQLGHNINYFGSNTAYLEKMTLLLTGYLIRTYTQRVRQGCL